MSRRTRSIAKRLTQAVALAVLAGAGLHVAVQLLSATQPPRIQIPAEAPVARSGGIRALGASYVKRHGGVLQVGLSGTPEQIGHAQAKLLYPEMLDTEAALWSVFDQVVPSAMLRGIVLDVAQLRFRDLQESIPEPRRVELAAQARAFAPDPWAEHLPTYQRFVFLNSLYDISLSFERSGLIGCSSVVLGASRTHEGRVLLGRNFDFETHEVFDRGKAVLLVREQGSIPFASVAWPGLLGVVTGMNAQGVAIVVHGARAGTPSPRGEPVLMTVRGALSHCSTASEAAAYVAARTPMVSHLVLVADATGSTAVVERLPGQTAHIREPGASMALTNHFEGPVASDPANQRVRARTSTLARRARLDELLAALPGEATPADVAAILRDKSGKGGERLPDGDRRAIDADIATHGVVMDLTARRIWVSEGPHLRGKFVRFDLRVLLDDSYTPELADPVDPIP